MPITTSLRKTANVEIAKSLIDELQFRRANYYYFIGGVSKWNSTDTLPVVAIPDTTAQNRSIRSEMVYLKKISPNEVSLVVPRHDWESGEIYDQWDDLINMED